LESEGLLAAVDTLLDDGLDALECAPADEEDISGIDLNEVLMRMLASTLRRHVGDAALNDLQERLLHAFAGNVAGDRRIGALAGDVVDLVDVDDAPLGAADVVVGSLNETEEN